MKTILITTIMAAAVSLSALAADSTVPKTLDKKPTPPDLSHLKAGTAPVAVNATPPEKTSGTWIDSVSIAPIGAIKTPNIDGKSQWGAGIRVGASVNPYVTVIVDNLGFEGYGQNTRSVMDHGKDTGQSISTGEQPWGGSTVDETDILVKAKISRFSTEAFSLYGIGGGLWDWNLHSWGFSAGLGVGLDFNKNFGLFTDYSLQAMFKEDPNGSSKRSLARFGVNFSF